MYSSNAISDVFNNIDERHTCGSYHQSLSSSSGLLLSSSSIYIVLNVITFIIGADKSRL